MIIIYVFIKNCKTYNTLFQKKFKNFITNHFTKKVELFNNICVIQNSSKNLLNC